MIPYPEPAIPKPKTYYRYESAKDGRRMEFTVGQYDEKLTPSITLVVDVTKVFQSVHGFGGAFTDSAGLNIRKLSPDAQDKLIKAYFCKMCGSGYSLGRIPIGGTDFSTRPYTYDDVDGDVDLKHFSLADEDFMYKIPYIKKAMVLNPDIKFFSAPWSAPPWMKTSNDFDGGYLKTMYYQTYTNYLMKYLDAYAQYGIKNWALSTGNEPLNVYIPFFKINSMGWTPAQLGKWIGENLGPTLKKSKYNETLIMILDDQRFELPWYPNRVFKNENARAYTDIIAVHWYWDTKFSTDRLDQTHEMFPEKMLLMTEACTGTNEEYNQTVDLGSWERAERYALDIIENFRHWFTGWTDWNLALDMKGGPNWVKNNVDAAIIVNADRDEFYKQPMYYAIQHFSKFVQPGSQRISIDDSINIKSIAFVTPINQTIVVLYNKNSKPESVAIKDLQGPNINLVVQPFSINTIIYSK